MKRFFAYTLLVLALSGSILPTGRCLAVVLGDCDASCAKECCKKDASSDCCRAQAGADTYRAAQCFCSVVQFSLQASPSINPDFFAKLSSLNSAPIASPLSVCALLPQNGIYTMASHVHPPDTPLYLDIRTLLV